MERKMFGVHQKFLKVSLVEVREACDSAGVAGYTVKIARYGYHDRRTLFFTSFEHLQEVVLAKYELVEW